MTTKQITKEQWDQEVLSQRFAVADFWADWCGKLLAKATIFEDISNEMQNIAFVKINVGEEMELAQKYGVQGLPTIKFFCHGKEIASLSGFRPKDELRSDIGTIYAEAEQCAENISKIN